MGLISILFTKLSVKRNVGAGIRTRGCWVRSADTTSVLCRPPNSRSSWLSINFKFGELPVVAKKGDQEWTIFRRVSRRRRRRRRQVEGCYWLEAAIRRNHSGINFSWQSDRMMKKCPKERKSVDDESSKKRFFLKKWLTEVLKNQFF